MPFEINDDDTAVMSESYTCYGCHSTYDGEPAGNTSTGSLCYSCYGVCVHCDGSFNMNSGSLHASLSDGYACGRCTRSYYCVCNCCDEWVEHDNTSYVSTSDERVCSDCLDSNYEVCNGCSEWCYSQNYDHFDECVNNRYIHDYNYRPNPLKFLHLDEEFENARIIRQDTANRIRKYKQIAYMGFELEVECEGDRNDYNNGASLIHDEWSDFAYMKQDGSLNYGIEIVTHPMTLGYAMSQIDWDVLERLNNFDFKGWYTSTAGLHVHVSRDGFESEIHQAKFVHFVHRNETFLSWLAGRESSRWASFSRDQLNNLPNKIKGRSHSDRYMAVNLNNSGTLEVRIFRSSLKPERIQMALQLVDAIVNYTQELPTSEMVSGKGFLASTFTEWVSKHEKYAVLSDYLSRWTEPFTQGSSRIGE